MKSPPTDHSGAVGWSAAVGQTAVKRLRRPEVSRKTLIKCELDWWLGEVQRCRHLTVGFKPNAFTDGRASVPASTCTNYVVRLVRDNYGRIFFLTQVAGT
jgi:hypothetical protein